MVDVTKGWKGYVGAVIAILAGIYIFYSGDKAAGAGLIGVGLSLLGIRHHLEYSEE